MNICRLFFILYLNLRNRKKKLKEEDNRMKYVFLVSHGTFAPGLHNALNMLAGENREECDLHKPGKWHEFCRVCGECEKMPGAGQSRR